MRTERFSAQTIVALLRERAVASISEVMEALGTASLRTACRKLAAVPCRSSYSHGGGYYTLDELADYDERGLWSCGEVRFSVHGTLVATAEALVEASEAGHFADELGGIVGVGTQNVLRKLSAGGRLVREKEGGRFLYCSKDPVRKARQVRARRSLMAAVEPARAIPEGDGFREATVSLMSVLDERQRRLLAGWEALRQGRGGDQLAGKLFGVDRATVAKGRRQLLSGDFETARVRKPGGGRKAVEKKVPKSPG